MCLLAFVQRPSTVTVGTAVPCWLQPETTDPSTHNRAHTHARTRTGYRNSRTVQANLACMPGQDTRQESARDTPNPNPESTQQQRDRSDPTATGNALVSFPFFFSFSVALQQSRPRRVPRGWSLSRSISRALLILLMRSPAGTHFCSRAAPLTWPLARSLSLLLSASYTLAHGHAHIHCS